MELKFKIVVVGASAGGVEGLESLVAGLPADLPAAIFIVLHIRPDVVSNLPRILGTRGALPALHARDGDEIRPGHIYIAPPDHHLLVDGSHMAVKKGPKENRFRPSIDALFRSAAYAHGPRVIGVILSGALDDGTSGLWSIKRFGGMTVVQDPSEAAFDSMPRNALEQVDVDYTLPVKDIGSLVTRLVQSTDIRAIHPPDEIAERTRIEIKVAASTNAFRKGILDHGELSLFTCPECHGALVKITEGSIMRFRCHTGHGYTASALLAGITEAVEPALWGVTRALEECVLLLDEMAQHFIEAGKPDEAEQFTSKARETQKRAAILQTLTIGHEHLSRDTLRKSDQDIEAEPNGD